MSLRDTLEEILPALLPRREEDAVKGTELIARVRAVLGDTYSDRTLRSQFSFIALEPDGFLARVPNGQGYYLRTENTPATLKDMFNGSLNADAESSSPRCKAFALAVRLYDTAGLGVFVYPVDEEEESWHHPDLVAVQWPQGTRNSHGTYVFNVADESTPLSPPSYRAVCVETPTSDADFRRAFFRALSCGMWAKESELLLLCHADDVPDELQNLALLYGVGIRTLSPDGGELQPLPRADLIFRAEAAEARSLIATLQQVIIAPPRARNIPLIDPQDVPDISVVLGWAQSCIERGRVEPYEQRVAVN